jgi:adenosine deaminase
MDLRPVIGCVPKSDLHVHLDGSLRLDTLVELARASGVALPSYDVTDLRVQVFKDRYSDLRDYLRGFGYTCAVLRTPEAVERVAFELAEDSLADGVRYIEVRLAPQLLVSRGNEAVGMLRAVGDGLARAARRFNALPAVMRGDDLPFAYGILCCAMRGLGPGMGAYYDQLLGLLPNMPPKQVAALASLEAARIALEARDRHGVPVVGFDLAGEEAGYRAGHHEAAYQEAHRHFLRKTVHAGEAYGPESIYEAITRCHAERIGHGTFLFAPERIADPAIEDREGYVESLVEYMASMRITVEVCPTSNIQTIPELGGSLLNHPVRKMIARQLAVAIATDNRLVSHTTLTDELASVAGACELDLAGVRRLVLAGFKGAFFPGTYAAKRAYVRQASELFDRCAARFNGGGK